MKRSEIKEGTAYRGKGPHSYREIDYLWESDGKWFVHWWCFLPVETKTGRTFHTPNRTCRLEHFARWAIEECK